MSGDLKGGGQKAIVFFARDFLSIEFPKLAIYFSGYVRVYVAANAREMASIRQIDADSIVFQIGKDAVRSSGGACVLDVEFNNDRYLRGYSSWAIAQVVNGVHGICDAILSRYDVRFYMDEPVSGYPNWVFNHRFSEAHATCLHFQTSWLPGFMFFVSDAAQRELVELGIMSGGTQAVAVHVETRRAGRGRPLYVLNYGKAWRRLKDCGLTFAKIVYRSLFRRAAGYVDNDNSAHWIHFKSLCLSFVGRYSPDPVTIDQEGKYVIYPLHYEPESVLNYFSVHSRQEEIAAQVLDSLPLGYKLILKEHPSQPGALHLAKWRSLIRSSRVVALRGDYDARKLFAMDVVVVSIGSTMALEAAVAGRPVGVLGDVHFAKMPGITKLNSPREWRRLLSVHPVGVDEIIAWYGEFLDKYCFSGSIMRGRTEFAQFSECIRSIDNGSPQSEAIIRA